MAKVDRDLNNTNVMVEMTFCPFVIAQAGHWFIIVIMAGKAAKSIFEFSAKLLNGDVMLLSSLKGKVVLIQNVASF